jgi:hypothetical protein
MIGFAHGSQRHDKLRHDVGVKAREVDAGEIALDRATGGAGINPKFVYAFIPMKKGIGPVRQRFCLFNRTVQPRRTRVLAAST